MRPATFVMRMLLRIREEAPNGKGHRLTRRVRLLPDLVETEREVAGSEHRIVPKAARQPDVRPLALDLNFRIAEVARYTGSDRDRQPRLDQLRRLFDVHLHPGPNVLRLQRSFPRAHRLDIGAAVAHVFGERASAVRPPRLQRAVRQHAERCARADVGDLEPNAFLRPYCHRGHVARGRDAQRFQRLRRNKSGDDARRAVEVAAVRDQIKVRAHHDSRPSSVMSGKRHEEVRRVIVALLEPEPRCPFPDDLVGELLARPVGVTGDARQFRVETARTQLLEERGNLRLLSPHRSLDICTRKGHRRLRQLRMTGASRHSRWIVSAQPSIASSSVSGPRTRRILAGAQPLSSPLAAPRGVTDGGCRRSPTCQLRKALAGRSTSSARTERSVPVGEW